jgi:hypothetical protein
MGISEAARNSLYTALAEVIGDATETLLKAIPLYDYDEVATKADLAVLRSEFAGEMNLLRGEVRGGLADLRAELIERVEALRASNSRWMVALLITIVGAMASLRLIG